MSLGHEWHPSLSDRQHTSQMFAGTLWVLEWCYCYECIPWCNTAGIFKPPDITYKHFNKPLLIHRNWLCDQLLDERKEAAIKTLHIALFSITLLHRSFTCFLKPFPGVNEKINCWCVMSPEWKEKIGMKTVLDIKAHCLIMSKTNYSSNKAVVVVVVVSVWCVTGVQNVIFYLLLH